MNCKALSSLYKNLRVTFLKLNLIFSSLIIITSCSVYTAMNAPDPVNYKDIKLGEDRMNVISVLGTPKASESTQTSTLDSFEFIDGNSGGYKVRVLPYLAADVFTIGLAEIILWPLEKFALEGASDKAIISYNAEHKVNEIKVSKKSDGTELYYNKDTKSISKSNTTLTQAISPQEFEKTIPRNVTDDELAVTRYFDKIPENWPQKNYYETEDFRYWSIPSDIVNDQNEATISSKNKADMILAKEFPAKSLGEIHYETTHMEMINHNNKYRSWRLVRIARNPTN
jgi:hypothetical protein